ncbi:hypothetical protein EJ05DRAFT_537690 [Pseudovirgaria hyperparasitica]|uniref:Lysine-specific metallo-endopeptidase domain-containing protein n=1 Tax=Pseudovirgaria hyperparasitica TaxID=470096 RepID=A0A6A6W9S2_9PEZI|nr:uncharacterized protein EJ05DRAFT_537690 [Pseudovirgaria hyperparasitica]KAF2759423.1 hypothetical protein EJ05DRAFT_537690 [Pseudovirgaria hyperparasitica]
MVTLRLFALCACLLFTSVVAQDPLVKYWVHESCLARPAMVEAIDEAILMARLAASRMRNINRDLDILKAFRRVFLTELYPRGTQPYPERQAWDRVHWIMANIGAARKYERMSDANTHIYCDDQDRWARLPTEGAMWFDTTPAYRVNVNGMTLPLFRDAGKPHCKMMVEGDTERIDDENHFETYGVTYNLEAGAERYYGSWLSIITVCGPMCDAEITTLGADRTRDWTRFPLTYNLDDDSDVDVDDDDFTTFGNGEIQGYASVLVLHEFTHAGAFRTDDIEPAYGWRNIIRKPAQDALNNGENYGYFGALALLGAMGFKLSDNPAEAIEGRLVRAR